MKKYYLMAIGKNNTTAMYFLGHHYQVEKNYDLMKKYYLMAIDKNCLTTLHALGYFYEIIEMNFKLTKKYYLLYYLKYYLKYPNNSKHPNYLYLFYKRYNYTYL